LGEKEVGLGVDADGVVAGGFDVDGDVVLEEAELFEALGAFEEAGREGGEEIEGGSAVGVEPDVLPVGGGLDNSRSFAALRMTILIYRRSFDCALRAALRMTILIYRRSFAALRMTILIYRRSFDFALRAALRMTIHILIAIEGDGGAGEVEGAAVGGADNFDGVWVGDVLGGAADFEGADVDMCLRERTEERSDVIGTKERLVALDVDVDVRVIELGDGVKAVSAAGEIRRGEFDGDVEVAAERGDFFRVGGNEDMVELRAGAGGVYDPGE